SGSHNLEVAGRKGGGTCVYDLARTCQQVVARMSYRTAESDHRTVDEVHARSEHATDDAASLTHFAHCFHVTAQYGRDHVSRAGCVYTSCAQLGSDRRAGRHGFKATGGAASALHAFSFGHPDM